MLTQVVIAEPLKEFPNLRIDHLCSTDESIEEHLSIDGATVLSSAGGQTGVFEFKIGSF